MNKQEAKSVLAKYLEQYRVRSHAELAARVGANDVAEIRGPSGEQYQIEVQILWDNPRQSGGNIRVIGGIDNGRGISAFSPLTDSFIMNAEGKFIGE